MTRLALVFILLAAGTASAQDTPRVVEAGPLRLGLTDAVQRALVVSAQLRELEQQRVAAGADVDGARAERWPTAGVAAGYTRRSDINEFLIPQPPGQPALGFLNLPDNWGLSARATLPIYAGGRISGQIDAAVEGERATGLDLDARRRAVILETEDAYWKLVTARESERVLREGLSAFQAHLKDARNRERFGLAARNEVLAVEVKHERAELRRLRAENGAEVAEANLVRLLQLPPDVVIEPTEKLESPPPTHEDLEELARQALEARPEREGLLARLRAAEASVRVAQSMSRPQVGLTAGYLYANPNRNFVPPDESWRSSWDVGVEVSMRVFDGGRTSASVARAQANVAALSQRLDDLERHIRLEVTSAQLELRAALVAIRVADGAVAAAEESQRVSADRYREGVIPSSELLDAETAFLEAGLERTQALADARLAAAHLDRAVGR
ncbi:MAG: TolC family protein [Acidobacteria bacterium]|nr:TolC family protein [Acidobacteriota bacterium]